MELNYKGTKMRIFSAPEEEQIYCYTEKDPEQENACIGHLRADFGASGTEFWTSWFPHKFQIDAPEVRGVYSAELDNVVYGLRANGLLKDRDTMAKMMARWPSAIIKNAYSKQIALGIETQRQLYYLRCNPMKGDYNFYLYVYDKPHLMEVQRKAKKLPFCCITKSDTTNELIYITYGKKGCKHLETFGSPAVPLDEKIKRFNEYYGAGKAEIAAMLCGSTSGWHTPEANPKMYDEQGRLGKGRNVRSQNEPSR